MIKNSGLRLPAILRPAGQAVNTRTRSGKR